MKSQVAFLCVLFVAGAMVSESLGQFRCQRNNQRVLLAPAAFQQPVAQVQPPILVPQFAGSPYGFAASPFVSFQANNFRRRGFSFNLGVGNALDPDGDGLIGAADPNPFRFNRIGRGFFGGFRIRR